MGVFGAFTLVVAVLAIGIANLEAQDFSAIDAKNRNSVIFIKSVKQRKDGVGAPAEAAATGFIIHKDGFVLTNSHAVPAASTDETVQINGAERSRYNFSYPLSLVARDADVDVALLRFPDVGKIWQAVEIGEPGPVPLSGNLLVLGFPATIDLSSAIGILSSKTGPRGRWQTTLPLNYGDSGSPVFHTDGRVVGIAVGGRDDLTAVTYVIPITYARPMLDMARAAIVSAPPPPPSILEKKFEFYESADHEESKNVAREFCVPAGYAIQKRSVAETTRNGQNTRLLDVTVAADRPNCILVRAFIQGNGVRRIAGVVVDHLGRGWLGLDITVKARRL